MTTSDATPPLTLEPTPTEPVPVTLWGPPQPRPQRRAGWRHVVLGFALSLIVFPLALSIALALLTGAGSSQQVVDLLTTNTGAVLAGMVALWAGFLIAAWAGGRLEPGGVRAFLHLRFSWRDPLIAVGVVAVFVAVNVLASFALTALGANTSGMTNTGIVTTSTGWGRWAILLAVCVGAPVVEEIFFRGLVLRVAVRTFPKWVAIAIVGVLFGLMHVQGSALTSIYLAVSTGLLGMALAWLALRTGRLGTTICAHILFNTVNVLLAFAS